MPIFSDFLDAFKLALPVAAISFAMVWWALHKGLLQEKEKLHALKREIKALSKSRKKLKKKDRPDIHPVHRKWLKFGGGFYGIVAVYTYVLVEWQEIVSFISGFGGFGAFIRNLGIDVIIRMLIEGLMNFVTAIAWPVYWMGEFGGGHIWLWLGITYAGYWLGMKSAQRLSMQQQAGKD